MQKEYQNISVEQSIDCQEEPKEEEAKKGLFQRLLAFSFFQWNILVLITVSLVALSIFLASRSTIFTIPSETSHARKHFFAATERYAKNPLYWDAKLKGWLATSKGFIQEGKYEELVQQTGFLSDEVFVAFLLKELHLQQNFFNHCVIFTKENSPTPTFILSKYESKVWPLKIMISCELEMKFKNKQIFIEFSRLRRGEQELAPSLVWSYFGPELELFKQFNFITLPQGDQSLET